MMHYVQRKVLLVFTRLEASSVGTRKEMFLMAFNIISCLRNIVNYILLFQTIRKLSLGMDSLTVMAWSIEVSLEGLGVHFTVFYVQILRHFTYQC